MLPRWVRRFWQTSELTGVSLDKAGAYVVPPPVRPERLPRAVQVLLPGGAVIALENTRFDEDVKSSLAKYAVTPGLRIRPGTVWPRSHWLHFSATPEALLTFEHLLRSNETREVCLHFYAYAQQTLLVEWHDAFTRDPILVSRRVALSSMANFCSELGVSVPKSEEDNPKSR
jgi:hypothetical protein